MVYSVDGTLEVNDVKGWSCLHKSDIANIVAPTWAAKLLNIRQKPVTTLNFSYYLLETPDSGWEDYVNSRYTSLFPELYAGTIRIWDENRYPSLNFYLYSHGTLVARLDFLEERFHEVKDSKIHKYRIGLAPILSVYIQK